MSNNGSRKKSVSFSPRTHVRNQYEGVNRRTGRFTVNQVNYNVNATGNINMPGYVMSSPLFKPHSKSSLQTAETAISNLRKQKTAENNAQYTGVRRLNGVNASQLVSGLSPALSSVPYNDYIPHTAGLVNARRNMHKLQEQYGNAWVNATVLRETIVEMRDRELSQIKEKARAKINALEDTFYDETGFIAPTVIGRELHERIAQLNAQGLPQAEHKQALARLHADFDKEEALLPKGPTETFKETILELIEAADDDLETSERTYNKLFHDMVVVGKPIVRRTRKSLANRLRNAQAVANMEK